MWSPLYKEFNQNFLYAPVHLVVELQYDGAPPTYYQEWKIMIFEEKNFR